MRAACHREEPWFSYVLPHEPEHDPGGPLDFSPIHPPISAIHRVASASVGISGSTGFCRFFRNVSRYPVLTLGAGSG